ncbi:MAG: hypothetical protein DI558_03460 [Corynebacterium propinquum]|nr:MAG: hypothetical protein DI558_03460 [Corynebacterium propinquum]
MNFKFFSGSAFFFIVGLLLIAMSDGPLSWRAVVGFLCLILTLISAYTSFIKPQNEHRPIPLTENEKQALRETLNTSGLAKAARKLRQAHPEVSLTEAKHTLDTL